MDLGCTQVLGGKDKVWIEVHTGHTYIDKVYSKSTLDKATATTLMKRMTNVKRSKE